MSEAIEHHSTKETITDRDSKKYVIDSYEFSVCSKCATEFVSAHQARANEKQFANARRKEQGLLTTEQIAQIRKDLNLRQEDASQIFGGGANAFSKYELGYVTQSVAMDRLLRTAAKFPDTVLPFLEGLAGARETVKRKVVGIGSRSSLSKSYSQACLVVTEDVATLEAANAAWDLEVSTKRSVNNASRSREERYSEKRLSAIG